MAQSIVVVPKTGKTPKLIPSAILRAIFCGVTPCTNWATTRATTRSRQELINEAGETFAIATSFINKKGTQGNGKVLQMCDLYRFEEMMSHPRRTCARPA